MGRVSRGAEILCLLHTILIHSWKLDASHELDFTKPLLLIAATPTFLLCLPSVSPRMSLSSRTQLPSALHRPDASYHSWPNHCDLEGFCHRHVQPPARHPSCPVLLSTWPSAQEHVPLPRGHRLPDRHGMTQGTTTHCCAVCLVRPVLLITSCGAQVTVAWCWVPMLHLQRLWLRTGLDCQETLVAGCYYLNLCQPVRISSPTGPQNAQTITCPTW